MHDKLISSINSHEPDANPNTATSAPLEVVSAVDASATDASATDAPEFLLFRLHGALYAIAARAVREVHRLPQLAPLAETAPDVAGVVNLRGRIVPVLDISRRLRQRPQPHRLSDCIAVLEQEQAVFALLVHGVERVQTISSSQIEAPPGRDDITHSDASRFLVEGVAKVEGEVVGVLSLDNLARLAQETLNADDATNSSLVQTSFDNLDDAVESGSDDEREFRERARRLMPPIQEQSSDHRFPVALIQMQDEFYGIALEAVREFSPLRPLSPVPCCPPHILGQMNLRGELVTLVDIQPLLQLPPRVYAAKAALNGNATKNNGANSSTDAGSIVVVNREGAPVGIVIDGVLDVLHLNEAEITNSPALSQATGARYFSGGVRHDGKTICILDVQKLLLEGGLVVDEAA